VELKNEFEVSVPIEQAWPLLLDVASVAECVPGGELVEKISDRSFKGRISVKLGPVLLTFEGLATFNEIDEGTHCARVEARGTDKKGRGTAQANVVIRLLPNGTVTKVSIVTDLQLAGSVAQYGRASGLIAEVSQHLVDDFSANLNRRIAQSVAGAATGEGDTPAAPLRSTARPVSALEIAFRVLSNALARLFKKLAGNA
jgi:carbon monoxide dehydrogenase subunit G